MCVGERLVAFLASVPQSVFSCNDRCEFPRLPHMSPYRHLYGDCECACMLNFVPVSLAAFSRAAKTPLGVMALVSLIAVFIYAGLYVG